MNENAREFAKDAVNEYLGERLELAQRPPGLRDAVEARFADMCDEVTDRVKNQIKHLDARDLDRPQAYYAHQEALETSLQEAAAGIRTAMAMEGHLVEATPFEQAATRKLASTAAWAIRSEAARVPRPPTRPAALSWTLPAVPWLNDSAYTWPPPEAVVLQRQNEFSSNELPRCTEAPYENWVQLGLIERQHTYATKHPDRPARRYIISTGLEVTNGDPRRPDLPFAGSIPTIWTHRATELEPALHRAQAHANLSALARPLVALLDFDTTHGIPHPDMAPGLHPFLLAPHIELSALLELSPESPSNRLMLIDCTGPALVCRQWSSFPIHDGNYEPLEPAIVGTDLLLRPDLYDTAVESIGPTRLRIGLSLQVAT